MGADYTIAKDVLTENEKNRILALYLNCDEKQFSSIVDWQAATTAFGSASIDSMKISLRNSIKKVEKATENGGVARTSEKKTPGGRKRKGKADGAAEDGSPTPAKKGRVVKKERDIPAEGDDEQTADGGVKKEKEDDSA